METKKCTMCGMVKPIDDFPWRNKANGTHRANCKICHSNYMKNKYQEKIDIIQQLKIEKGCKRCGYNQCGASLEFHHINPLEKDEKISKMISNRYDLSKIYKEIEKCVILCANCHHEFHYLNNKNSTLTIEDYCGVEKLV